MQNNSIDETWGRSRARSAWIWVTLALVVVAVVVGGCVEDEKKQVGNEIVVNNNVPASPISIKISLSNAPTIERSADLNVSTSSAFNSPNTTIQIFLPKEFNFINGKLEWNGDLKANESVELKVTFRPTKVGSYRIKATAKSYQEGSWYGDSHTIYIYIYENKTILSESPYPEKVQLDNQTNETISGPPPKIQNKT